MQSEGALAIGTQVSAKYKGAFCEAKVRSVDKLVKVRVTFKFGLGSTTVSDKDIKTDKPLVQGATVLAKHPDKQEFFDAVVKEIKDQSRYTVTFNDGDIATLRRNALCMKSGKHYNASESLDNLPLTHPEHFSTPVGNSRRRSGRGNQSGNTGADSEDYDSSSDGEEISSSYLAHIGRVVWAETTDRIKGKGKDTWFPALIVAPSASDTVKIDTKEEFLIRSFKDGRYYTVSKKDTNRFHKEAAKKPEKDHIRDVIDKAVAYLERDELPPHWDREILFNMGEESTTESSESEEIDEEEDDESPEEKDHLVAELYKHMEDRGAPINKTPTIDGREVDLYRLFKIVYKCGGHVRVTNKNLWQQVAKRLGFETAWCVNQVRVHYKRYLQSFEQLNRTLGCTMKIRVSSSNTGGGRSQIRGLHRSVTKEALSPASSTSSSTNKAPITADIGETEKAEITLDSSFLLEASPSPTLQPEVVLTSPAIETPSRLKPDPTTVNKPETKPAKTDVKLKAEPGPKSKPEGKVKTEQSENKEELVEKENPKESTTNESDESPTKIRESRKNKAEKSSKERQPSRGKSEPVEEPKTPVSKKKAASATEKDGKMTTRPRRDSTSSLAAAIQNKEKKDNIGDSNMKPMVVFYRNRDVEKEAKKFVEKEAKKAVDKDIKKSVEKEVKKSIDKEAKKAVDKDIKKSVDKEAKKVVDKEIKKVVDKESKKIVDKDAKKVVDKEAKKSLDKEAKKVVDKEAKKIVDKDIKKNLPKVSSSVIPQPMATSPVPPLSTAGSLTGQSSGKSERDSSNDRDSVTSEKKESGRGRKKSGVDKKSRPKIAKRDPAEDESMNGDEKQHLAPNVEVSVGDKIKVFYKRDTIYDAKVVRMKQEEREDWPKYYVHYQGWNARYDEWIKRSRIAENLSWNKERAKKSSVSSGESFAEVKSEPACSQSGEQTAPASEIPDEGNTSESPAKSKRERSVSKSQLKSAKPESRAATPSSVTSKSSRTGSPMLKRQTSRVSKKESTDSDDDIDNDYEEEDEEEESETSTSTEPRKSSRLQKTPISEKKKGPGRRKRPLVTKPESETDVDVEKDDDKEVKTPIKPKRGRKPAAVSTAGAGSESEKPVKQPETPRSSRSTPSRERTPKSLKSNRRSAVKVIDEEDPYAFKEPEPFEEVKFETPRKSPGKKSAKVKAEKSGKKSTRSVGKVDSEESNDSSSDEAGKKLARGRAKQKLAMTIESSTADSDSEKPLTIDEDPPADVEVPAETSSSETSGTTIKAEAAQPEDVSEDKTDDPPVSLVVEKAEENTKEEVVEPAQEVLKQEQVLETTLEAEPVGEARPILQLSKKQQELFPHLAAIRTTTVPFSRPTVSSSITAKSLTTTSEKPAPSTANKCAPSEKQTGSIKKEMEEEKLGKELPHAQKVDTPIVVEVKPQEDKAAQTRPAAHPPAESEAVALAPTPKKQRKTPKKPNSSELVESDSDSGAESEKKVVVEKSKRIRSPKQSVVIGVKRKEPDSSEDEPLGLRGGPAKIQKTSSDDAKKKQKRDDLEELDLACAETIPGSPVHTSSVVESVTSQGSSSESSDVKTSTRLEMPFASVPESLLENDQSSAEVNMTTELKDEDVATPVTDNKSASQSPRQEAVECSKSTADSSEVDMDSLSELPKSESLDVDSVDTKKSTTSKRKALSDVGSRSPMHGGRRKRRTREAAARGRGGRGRYATDRLYKGDDDYDEGDDHHSHRAVSSLPALGSLDNDALAALAQRSPNSKKYNFFVDLDPKLDSSERIARLQNSLKELRKTYHSVKNELAIVERRRKKIKRKERERTEKGLSINPVETAA